MVENAEQLRHFTSPIASVNKPLAEGRQSIGCCLLQQGLGIGGYTDIVVHVWLSACGHIFFLRNRSENKYSQRERGPKGSRQEKVFHAPVIPVHTHARGLGLGHVCGLAHYSTGRGPEERKERRGIRQKVAPREKPRR